MAAANAAIALVSYPVLLHFLGYERYGVWLALSTVLTFAQLGNVGMSPAVSKLVAECHISSDINGIQRAHGSALITVLVSGTVVLAAVTILRFHIVRLFGLRGANEILALQLIPYIAAFSIYIFVVELSNAALLGLGRADLESILRTISQFVALALSAVLLFAKCGVAGLLIANAFAYLVMHLTAVVLIHQISGARMWIVRRRDLRGVSGLLRFGRWVFGSSVVTMTFHPMNRVLISRYAGIAALPLYEIAWGSSMKVRSLLESGFRAMMPEVSRLTSPLTDATLNRVVALRRAGCRVILRFATPMYVVIFALTVPLLTNWMRSSYNPVLAPEFRIMLVGSFASLLSVPAYYLLLGLGQARSCFLSGLIQATTVFFLAYTGLLAGIAVSPLSICAYVTLGMSLSASYLLYQTRRSRLARLAQTAPISDLPDQLLRARMT